MLYVSFGSKVRPRTFGCVAMGNAVLFILRSRLLLGIFAGFWMIDHNSISIVVQGSIFLVSWKHGESFSRFRIVKCILF